MKRCLALLLLLFPLTATAAPPVLEVTGGATTLTNVVISAPLPAGFDAGINSITLPDGMHIPAQIGEGWLLTDPVRGKRLTFVLPKLHAGETLKLRPTTLNYVKAPLAFQFKETPGEYVDLLFDQRPVLRYINKPRDGTTKDTHELTFKPYHGVFDPTDGKSLITSTAYLSADKTKMFPHHRGLFYGWLKISYGDKTGIDTWHGRKGEYTQHEKMLLTEAGEVYGQHRAAISWHGQDGARFADEQREVTAFNMKGGTLIEFASVLSTKQPLVKLDGDPQHAGFHFRAHQDVSAKENSKQTVYTRPDGKDKPAATRNWPAQKEHVNLAWDAMSFTLHGKRYTAVYLDRPDNPKEARFSERDYGRFGSYFVYDLTPETPLKVKYRVWIQEGELTADQCENLSQGFVHPPAVSVK